MNFKLAKEMKNLHGMWMRRTVSASGAGFSTALFTYSGVLKGNAAATDCFCIYCNGNHTGKEDILQLLDMKDPYTITTGFERKNLYFAVKSRRINTRHFCIM